MTPGERTNYLTRWSALKTERASWDAHWREIAEFTLPRSSRFLVTDVNKGTKKNGSIIDSTGSRALRTLAAGLMSGTTSPAKPWFRLATTDADLMDYEPVKQWLDSVTVMMRNVFARSNTYRALHSIYEELGAFGTGASIIAPDFESVIHHTPLTVGQYAIAANPRGEVSTLYREFSKTTAQLVAEFGLKNCSQRVQSDYGTNRNLDAWHTVIHAIEPRADRDPRKKGPAGMAWKSVYFEAGSNEGRTLSESGFRRFPAVVPRWATTGGDVYGHSPGMEALGDIKQLQHQQRRKGQAIDYKVKPPLQVPTSLQNLPVATLPGGVAYVDATSAQAGIRTMFEATLDLSHLLEDIHDVRQRIDRSYYVDLFLFMQQLDAVSGRGQITAREIAERHEEKLLMPKIDLTFDRIVEAGILPPPPDELAGVDLNVEFVSVLAQAQRAVGLGSVDRLLGTVVGLAQMQANSGATPDVADKINSDTVIDKVSDMLGIDPDFIVSSDQVAIVRQQRAQAQAQAQAAQAAQASAATAKDLSAADTEGPNALTDLLSQFSGYGGG